MNEASGADGGGINYEGQSAYDVADMMKQYFRDLPEPLLTSKLSETFLQIYQCNKTKINYFVLGGFTTYSIFASGTTSPFVYNLVLHDNLT